MTPDRSCRSTLLNVRALRHYRSHLRHRHGSSTLPLRWYLHSLSVSSIRLCVHHVFSRSEAYWRVCDVLQHVDRLTYMLLLHFLVESISRSPYYSHIGETISGVVNIRAYSDTARFTARLFQALNDLNRPAICLWLTDRWLTVRFQLGGACFALAAALYVILDRKVEASLAGFVLTCKHVIGKAAPWKKHTLKLLPRRRSGLGRTDLLYDKALGRITVKHELG